MTNQAGPGGAQSASESDVQALKRSARTHYLGLRRALDERDRAHRNTQLCTHLLDWLRQLPAERTGRQHKEAGIIGVYAALFDEADVESFARAARRLGWKTAYPKAHVATRALSFHLASDEQSLVSGAYGIREPHESAPAVDPADIGVLVVPGVAFTRDGVRLGYGGGYYDRLLPRTQAVTIGAAYSCQIADDLPADPLDKPVTAVVTEAGILRYTPQSGGAR